MNKKLSYFVILIFSVINPVLYLVNGYLLIFGIFIEILIFLITKEDMKIKLWQCYFISFQYFGVSILSIKIYDIVFLAILIYIILTRKNYKSNLNFLFNKTTIILCLFCIYVFMIFYLNEITFNTSMEFIRYIVCGFIFILVMISFRKIDLQIDFFLISAVKNVISGIVIFFISKGFGTVSFKDSFISIESYFSMDSVRISGFFSDPNKYFLYFMMLLIIADYISNNYIVDNIKNKMLLLNLICTIGIILSLSRTAIICMGIFYIVKAIRIYIFRDNFVLKKVYFTASIILFLMYLPNVINKFDNILYSLTVVIGRADSLRYSSSLGNSNRMIVWISSFKIIRKNLMFGSGLSSWTKFFSYPTHNSFIAVLLDLGVIGLIIFILMLKPLYEKLSPEAFIALVFLPMMTLDLQNLRLLYILLAIVLLPKGELVAYLSMKEREYESFNYWTG